MNKSQNLFLARTISTLLNPIVLVTPVPYILVYKITGDPNLSYFWEIVSFIFILILCLFILLGIERHFFTDFDISKRTQRPLLFTFAIGLSAIYTILLYALHAPYVLFIAIFSLIAGLICIELINKITKVSVHVATISAFATFLAVVYGELFLFSFVLVPIVAWARIRTHNHSLKQTLIGAILGIVISLSVYVIFEYII